MGSVYFIVKTEFEATTKRKPPKGRKKTKSNYGQTKRHQKAERMPKEPKPLKITNKP